MGNADLAGGPAGRAGKTADPNGRSSATLLDQFPSMTIENTYQLPIEHDGNRTPPEFKAMITRRQASAALLSTGAFAATQTVLAQEAAKIELPPPRTHGGKPLIQALRLRRSIREYADKQLAPQALSDLLWAAFGINRPATGDRTAPYWRHVMVIDIYAAMADGVWLYEPKQHALIRHLATDIRPQTGTQEFVGTTPLYLIYVAHGERMQDVSAEDRRLYASVDTGFIGQNVYLFCASEGLATVFRGAVDYQMVAKTLKLGAGQFVTFAQTIGYPKI